MTDLRTAAQQALEALESVQPQNMGPLIYPAKQALRAALAQQAEPVEPVAWYYERDTDKGLSFAPDRDPYKCWQPLHTAPPQRPAEPVQEPVAWLYEAGTDRTLHWYKPPLHGTPLYTAPPQRKPLSEEEISDLSREMVKGGKSVDWLCRAVERAHGIEEKK